MEEKTQLHKKTIKIFNFVISVNKAWYFTLCLGVIVNLWLNIDTSRENNELTVKVSALKEENLKLQASVDALLDNMVSYNRTFDDFDLEVWSKVKRDTVFYANFYNLKYEKEHFTPFGETRFSKLGRTDYDHAPKWMADIWNDNNMKVALTGISDVFHEPFPLENEKVGWGYFYKWRKIPNKDTLLYGMKLPKKK